MAVSASTILPLLLCSAIEITAAAFSASGPYKPRNWGYSLAVGITSLFVCAAFLLLAERQPDALSRPISGGPSLQTLLALFLLLWWAAGAGVLTFMDPFRVTSNGYFSCWAGVALSMYLVSRTVPALAALDPEAVGRSLPTLASLLLSSIVVLCAALADNGDMPWEVVFALVVAITSAALVLVQIALAHKCDGGARSSTALLLVVLWSVEVLIATFKAPFVATTNGYFGSWTALGCSAMLAAPTLPCLPQQWKAGLRFRSCIDYGGGDAEQEEPLMNYVLDERTPPSAPA